MRALQTWKVLMATLSLALLSSTAVQAASIRFEQPSVATTVGESFSVKLLGDFTGDATLGGGLDIAFDAGLLEFLGFDFGSASFALDPGFSRQPDRIAGKAEGLGFGNFAGLAGQGVIGTASFRALAPGATELLLSLNTKPAPGPFVSATSFDLQAVTFATTDVTISAVPLPGALWLFGGALLGLVARRR